MAQEATGYPEWTPKELVRETVGNLESLEGVYSVEWVTHLTRGIQYGLIRVRTHKESIIRLLITSQVSQADAEMFDDILDALSR